MNFNLNLLYSQAYLLIGGISSDSYERLEHWLPLPLENASENRKKEFLAGRYCAEQACKKLLINLKSLPFSEGSKVPKWPENILGSISHTKGYAIAIVAEKKHVSSVGVDIERVIIDRRISVIEKMVLTNNDKKTLSNINHPKKELYTLIFSAKESLYKLIYPFCKVYFDFREADVVAINFEKGEIELNIISERPELRPYRATYQGHFSIEGNIVLTYFVLLKK